jgi:glycosyltransferase involved in cell wall biosynthesis
VKELSWPTLVRLASWHRAFRGNDPFVVRATQGQLPGAAICDAHFCHRAYLDRYFTTSGTRGIRKVTRSLVHRHGARLERKAFQLASLIVVPSRGILREISDYYPFARPKLVHIPNAVDTDRFAPDLDFDRTGARRALGYGADEVVFLFVALGDFARKGLEVAMRGLGLSDSPSARLLVVGGTASEIDLYRRVAAETGVQEQTTFAGFHSDIRPFLWLADVFIFPSLYEASPKAVDQAMAAGLPVLGTRINGVEDIVEDGVNGWFAERTPEAFGKAIQRAVAARGTLPELGRRARLTAASYDKRFFAERWDALLRQVFDVDETEIGPPSHQLAREAGMSIHSKSER